ncbi:hypothetical protein SAMN05216466_107109 [Paraburkholderia phenazinium]|uniref:Uncharacterized protein n=1 Tax=Paraburkholderia phenazinium TaxID=60549 RepID=A0A1G7ZNW3_9BURK|nr:hypothetical protein SAMN05216466_107109 [Paraburkholderia phenazinium]
MRTLTVNLNGQGSVWASKSCGWPQDHDWQLAHCIDAPAWIPAGSTEYGFSSECDGEDTCVVMATKAIREVR